MTKSIDDIISKTSFMGNSMIDTKHQCNLLAEATKGYSIEAIKLAVSQSNLNREQITAILSQKGLKGEVLETTVAELEQSIANGVLSASQTDLSAKTIALSTAFKGLWATIKANPIFWITSAVTVGITVWNKYKQSIEEAVSAASEASTTFVDQTKTIDDAVTKYKELREQLIEAKGDEEATYEIKQQLLELQTELNDTFGDEYDKLNLVTDAYRDQTEVIKAYNKEAANKFLNKNDKGIDIATKKMTDEEHYNLSGTYISELTDEGKMLKQIAQEYEELGVRLADNLDNTFSIHLDADAQTASDVINDFMTEVRDEAERLGYDIENNLDLAGVIELASKSLNSADAIIEEYGDIFKQAQIANITTDDKLSSGYNEALSAVEAYNEAVLKSEDPYNDENVKSAWNYMQTVKQGIKDNTEDWGQYSNLMDDVFDSANDKVYSFYQTLQNDGTISSLAEELRGLSEVDLQSMIDDGNNGDTWDKLYSYAEEAGIEVQELINLLIELSIVQGQVASGSDIGESISAFSTTEAIEKLKELEDSMSDIDEAYASLFSGEKVDVSTLDGIREKLSEISDIDMSVVNDALDQIGNADSLDDAQSAMNALATECLNASGIMEGLDESNRDLIVRLLESVGIKNADELATTRLAKSTELLTSKEGALVGVEERVAAQQAFLIAKKNDATITSENLENATYDEINAIIAEGNASAGAQTYLAQLALSKLDLTTTKIDTVDEVSQIIALANAAGTSIEYVKGLREALLSLVSASTKNYVADFGMDTGNGEKKIDAVAARVAAQKEVDQFLDNTAKLNPADFYANYTGGSSTQSVKDKSNSSSNSSKETEETFDFIETKIERLTTLYDKLKSKAEKTFSSMTTRANAYAEAIQTNNELIATQEQAYSNYLWKALQVGLDEYWAAQVRNGSINIEDITDDTLKDKINEYQEWFEKSLDCAEAIEELREEQSKLARESIELVITNYDKMISKVESANDRINKKIDIKETLGFSASASDYTKMNTNIQKQIRYNDEQITQLKKLQSSVENSSEAWYEYQERIDSTNASTQDLTLSMIENAKAAAALPGEKAKNKIEKYDAKDELLDTKIDTATSAKSKNSLINKKIDNIDKRKETYVEASKSSSKSLKNSSNSILNVNSKETAKTDENAVAYNKILEEVKQVVASGKGISSSLLSKVKNSGNTDLYNRCLKYNASIDQTHLNELIQEAGNDLLTRKAKDANTPNLRTNEENEAYNSILEQIQTQIKNGETISSYLLNQARMVDRTGGLFSEAMSYNQKYATRIEEYRNSLSKSFIQSSSLILNTGNKNTSTMDIATSNKNKKYNNVLNKVKAKVKSGDRISESLLNSVKKIDENLWKTCVQYNADYDARKENEEIYRLYVLTAQQEKATLREEQLQNNLDKNQSKYDKNVMSVANSAKAKNHNINAEIRKSKANATSYANIRKKATNDRKETGTDAKFSIKKATGKLKKRLKTVMSAIKSGKTISSDGLKAVKEYCKKYLRGDLTYYYNCEAYNEAVENELSTKEQETLAKAEQYALERQAVLDKADNTVASRNEKNELYAATAENQTTAKKKNSYIDRQKDNIAKNLTTYKDTYNGTKVEYKSARKVITKSSSKDKSKQKIINAIKSKYTNQNKLIPSSYIEKAYTVSNTFGLACEKYNEALEAKNTSEETYRLYEQTSKQEIADLTFEQFNNTATEYDNKTLANEQKKTELNNKISLAEAQGKTVNTAYYKGLIFAEEDNQNILIQKRKKLQKSLNAAVANGSIKEGSDEWYEMVQAINDTTNAIDEGIISIQEYANAIRQIEWDTFDKSLEGIKRINSEADYYINLMSNKDMVDKDTGDFTEYGTATLGLHNTNYESYIAQAKAYQEEYNDLMKKIRKGDLSLDDEEVISRLRELQDGHRGAMESAEGELQSIQELVKQGYEAQIDALSELIDKYKKLKDSELEAYNYQKQIAEKTKNIASLQKQLMAYGQNTDSEESRAQIQKLKVELQEAQDDLKDTQYEKFVSDTEDMLDELMDNYQEFIDEKLSDTNSLLTDIKSLIGDDSSIVHTLKSLDEYLTKDLKYLIMGRKDINNVDGITGFSTGGAISGLSGDKNIIRVANKERVLTPVQNELWEKWTEKLPQLVNMPDQLVQWNIQTPDYGYLMSNTPATSRNVDTSTTINVGDIVMNGVNDMETFGRQMREEILRNGKTTNCITEAVSAKQLGRNGVGNARLYK